ncbi:DNA-binding protein [Arthrobacter sp. 162MFSha1.1]|uniref:DNA-binding protein n=1 Tax=Arthrobacter sp. 162MFSha1.1 TaxID=1151119 RepID=UPI00035D7D48|nr:DNA-binding protein [Arthrobacter sp. 162MFSha1.1]
MTAYAEAEHVPQVAYRVKEVAAALGLTLAACYQQVESGAIPHVRVGGRVFIPARFFTDLGLRTPVRVRYGDGAVLGVPPAYTVAEVAAALGSAIPNVYGLAARKVIPTVKDGTRRMVPAEFFAKVGLEAPVLDLRK